MAEAERAEMKDFQLGLMKAYGNMLGEGLEIPVCRVDGQVVPDAYRTDKKIGV